MFCPAAAGNRQVNYVFMQCVCRVNHVFMYAYEVLHLCRYPMFRQACCARAGRCRAPISESQTRECAWGGGGGGGARARVRAWGSSWTQKMAAAGYRAASCASRS